MRFLSKAVPFLLPVIMMLALAGCSSSSSGSGASDPFASDGSPGGAGQSSGSAPPASLTLLPGKSAALTNEESIVTATLKDTAGNPLANQSVSFSISAGPAVAVTSSARTDSSGVALAFVRTGATDVTTNVIVQASAAVGGASVVGYGSFQVSPGNANLISTKLSLSVPSYAVTPNQELVVTATAKDSAGNPLANQVVNFSVVALPAVMVNSSSTTDSHGIATAIVRAGNPPGVANVIVQAQTAVNGNQVTSVIPFQIVPVSNSGSNYTMSLTPSKNAVDNSEEFFVTALLKDASGSPVANQAVAFAVASGEALVIGASASTDSNGKAITRVQSLNPASTSSVILQATTTVNGTQVTALAAVQVTTQPYSASTLRMALASDKASVGINGDVLLTASVTDLQTPPVPVQNQSVTFSVVAGPATVLDQTVPTDSSGKAVARLRAGNVPSSSNIIVQATTSVFGATVNAYATLQLVRQSSYVITFLTTAPTTDPTGNLNKLSGEIGPDFVGWVTFKQLVPFQVLDNNAVPLPNTDVTVRVFNYGRNPDTIIELVPPWPGDAVVFPPDETRVTVRTDDHGMGIFTCNVSLQAPGPGNTNTESVTYQASATIVANGTNQLPANLALSSYGGFIVTVFQKNEQ